MPPLANYYALDLEFTHASHIIEIGVVSISDPIHTSFHTLAKPQVDLEPHVSRLTGITEEMLESAPSEEDAFRHFTASFQDVQHPFIIVWGSDEKVLRKVARRYGLEGQLKDFIFYDMKSFLEGFRFFCPEAIQTTRTALHEIAKSLGCDTGEPQTHRALEDARETARVVIALLQKFQARMSASS